MRVGLFAAGILREQGLCNGNKNCRSDSLGELDDCDANGGVLLRKNRLDCYLWALKADSDSKSQKRLITDEAGDLSIDV